MKNILYFPLVSVLISICSFAAPVQEKIPGTRPHIEVCFVLDTTGSMSGLIQGAKDKIWSIVADLQDADPVPVLKIGLVGYRDRGDEYIIRVHEMTDDLDAMFGSLLKFKADGGGDEPESVNEAVRSGLESMGWSADPKTYRTLFLVGDAPPQTTYDEPQMKELCILAKTKGILINTVLCGNSSSTRKIWQEIASATGGSFAAIEQNGGVEVVETPFDDEIRKLNRQVNDTVILYGNKEERQSGRGKTRNADADSSATVSRAVWNAKFNSGKAITGKEDLTARVEQENLNLESLDRDQLPETLQGKSPEELKVYIENQQQIRKQVLGEIRELADKRERFLQAELEKNGGTRDAFDDQVREATRIQAGAKGISYRKE